MASHPDTNHEVLHSWKDISIYTGRSVRTVQRWEQLFGFPVHRTSGALKGSVMAFRSEIDAWLRARALRALDSGNGVRHEQPADAPDLHLHARLQAFQQKNAMLRSRLLAFNSSTEQLAAVMGRTSQLREELSRLRRRNAG